MFLITGKYLYLSDCKDKQLFFIFEHLRQLFNLKNDIIQILPIFSVFYDIILGLWLSLSQFRFAVATTEDKKEKKSWNEAKTVVPLHRQKSRTRLETTK